MDPTPRVAAMNPARKAQRIASRQSISCGLGGGAVPVVSGVGLICCSVM
jgi:hypothetical protein